MQGGEHAVHPTRFDEIAVTVEFHCNSACRFCIVQEGMNRYRGLPLERFVELAAENQRSRKYRRVLFTGGEVTLEKSLPDFVRAARDSRSFEHIRLQTNGRRLADAAYAAALVADGIDEFFVSLHGADAAIQDAISQRPGSFDEAVRGLANLRALGVDVTTNTVINRYNVRTLAEIVARVADLGVGAVELWNYLPMTDHADTQDLIAPLEVVIPEVQRALALAARRGLRAVTKYLPYCLLGEHAGTLDNSQPDVLIVESFWDEFPRFACLYEAVCEHSQRCLGVHHDYVNKFGWEEARLRPTPRTTPWQEPDDAHHAGAVTGAHPAWEALLAGVEAAALTGVQLTRTEARYGYRLPGGGTLEVVLAGRNDTAPAFVRSRGFNVFYSNASGDAAPAEIEALMRSVTASLARHDQGQLTLDARKGLTAVRR